MICQTCLCYLPDSGRFQELMMELLLSCYWLAAVITGTLIALIPLFVSLFIQTRDAKHLVSLLLISLSFFALAVSRRVLFLRHSHRIQAKLRRSLLCRGFRVGTGSLGTEGDGVIDANQLQIHAQKLKRVPELLAKISSLIYSVSLFVSCFVLAVSQEWQLTLVHAFAVIPILFALIHLFQHPLRRALLPLFGAQHPLRHHVQEFLFRSNLYIAFNNTSESLQLIVASLRQIRKLKLHVAVLTALSLANTFVAIYLVFALLFWLVQLWSAKENVLGCMAWLVLMMAASAHVSEIVGWIRRNGGMGLMFDVGLMSRQSQGSCFNCMHRSRDGLFRIQNGANIADLRDEDVRLDTVLCLQPQIQFHRVTFSNFLHSTCMTFEPYELHCIIGPHASAVLELIARFVEIRDSTLDGLITIGTHDIQSIPIGVYRQVVGYVESTPRLFDDMSLLENLCFDHAKAVSMSELMRVLELVGLEGAFDQTGALNRPVPSLTLLEKRQFSLARILLRRPLVILLDNPFRDLAIHEQFELHDILKNIAQSTTTILGCESKAPGMGFGKMYTLDQDSGEFVYYDIRESRMFDLENLDLGLNPEDTEGGLDLNGRVSLRVPRIEEQQDPPRLFPIVSTLKCTECCFKRMLHLVSLRRWDICLLAFMVLGSFLGAFLTACFAIVFSNMLEACLVLSGQELESKVRLWCEMFVVLAFGGWIGYFVSSLCSNMAAARIGTRIQKTVVKALFEALLNGRLSVRKLQARWGQEELVSKMNAYYSAVEQAISLVCVVLQLLVCLLGGLVVSFAYEWKLTLIMMSTLPIVIGLLVWENYAKQKLEAMLKLDQDRLDQQLVLYIKASKTIRATQNIGCFTSKFASLMNGYQKKALKMCLEHASISALLKSMPALVQPFLLYFGSLVLDLTDGYQLKNLFIVYFAMGVSWYASTKFVSIWKELQRARKTLLELCDCLEELGYESSQQSKMHDEEQAHKSVAKAFFFESTHKLSSFIPSLSSPGSLLIKTTLNLDHQLESFNRRGDLGVKLDSLSSPLFSNWSLQIMPGQHCLLVGNQDAIKSLFDQLLRLDTPRSGEIRIFKKRIAQSVPLLKISAEMFRQKLGWVNDERSFDDNDSIYEAIVFGRTDVSWECVVSTCQLLGLHQLVLELPNGYDTKLTSSMADMSHLWKGIAVARALVTSPKMVLIDGLFGVDDEFDRALVAAIMGICSKTTTIWCCEDAEDAECFISEHFRSHANMPLLVRYVAQDGFLSEYPM